MSQFSEIQIAAIADVSQQMPYVDWVASVGSGTSCGIDGLALDPTPDPDVGPSLWIHCEFRRQVVHLAAHDPRTDADDEWIRGAELATSLRTPEVERGAELFRRARDSRISTGGALSCNGCHPEGRADGLAWRLGDSILQTPILAGRVADTAPYKWDGQDPTLHASLRHTMQRLGGDEHDKLSSAEVDALVAYLRSLPPPRPPKPRDAQVAEAIARGRAVFEAEGCDACHAGTKLADGNAYPFDTTLASVDTPSLLGLAHSRPYYHDGSAKDLWTLLTDRGAIHAMADLSALDDAALRDLEAYLESL